VLQFIPHAEGYVTPEVNGFKYVYQYKDNVDNVRLTYSDSNNDGSINPSTEIISEKNYYPFGMLQKGYNNVITSNANSVAEKFQYTGKELQEELGLNLYDYGARMYDPALGRFTSVDKLADHLRQINRSPYAYGWNNPVYYNDPDGNCPQCISGAIVGAIVEVLSQVGSSMLLDGLSFEESLEVLDYTDIGVETGIGALSGALDGGASKLAKFLVKKKNRKLLAKLLGVGIDFTVDIINSAAKNVFNAEEDVLTTDDIIEILISAGLGELADELLPKVSTKKVDKKIDKQTKKSKNSKSKKKRKKAKKKKKAAERKKAALDGVNSTASGTATSAATTGGKKVIDETKKEENK
jgi:RHS repeat-associated protein